MTTAEYRRLILRCRKAQLTLTRENVARLEAIYQSAADSLAARLEHLGDHPLDAAATGALLEDINAELSRLRTDTFASLDVSMTVLAQAACDREASAAEFAGAPADARLEPTTYLTHTLTSGEALSTKFGSLARVAVERTAARIYDDGFKLSERLYKLDQTARAEVADTIVQGVAEQISARELGSRIRDVMVKAGTNCPRFRAATIAQTEINNAHREAHVASLYDADGNVKGFVSGIGWRLSPSHPKVCFCDILASDDSDGLGAGNYLAGTAPTAPHPRCLCFTVTLLTNYPDLQFPGKEPKPGDLPDRLKP